MGENHEKLAELILYIADRHETDALFGSVRLAKTLFYADFLYYIEYGQSITGERYIRRPNGPMPDSLLDVRDQMLRNRELIMKDRLVGGYTQKRPIALREPNLDLFTATEISMVDYVLSQLEGKSATQVSDLSHRFEAWQMAEEGEEIPYQTAFISERQPTADDWAYARALAGQAE